MNYPMLQKLSQDDVSRELNRGIYGMQNIFDIQEREPTVQIVSWIKGQTEKELDHVLDDTYLMLQKKSSGDIVFPSGSIEGYEFNRDLLNPQGIILAALREFKEELHKIIGIDASDIIDIYPINTFESDIGKKYIQFRLLACLSPLKVANLPEIFTQNLGNIQASEQEHKACYIHTYQEILAFDKSGERKLKGSTKLSLFHHYYSKRLGKYG